MADPTIAGGPHVSEKAVRNQLSAVLVEVDACDPVALAVRARERHLDDWPVTRSGAGSPPLRWPAVRRDDECRGAPFDKEHTMAGTLIVVDQGDTFAVVGPDDSVLAHLSSPRLPDIVPAPVRDVGDRLLARLATTARAPGHPGGAMAFSRVGRLEAFDTDGRPVTLRSARGWFGRGATGPNADPEAVLRRLRRVIAHVNAEAVQQNPRRTTADETLVRSYLARGVLPIKEPETLRDAVDLLWESRYADPAGAGERLLRRTPLAGLVPAVESAIGPFRPGRPRLPDLPPTGDPPDAVPHRGGWFHNLWHAATGSS